MSHMTTEVTYYDSEKVKFLSIYYKSGVHELTFLKYNVVVIATYNAHTDDVLLYPETL